MVTHQAEQFNQVNGVVAIPAFIVYRDEPIFVSGQRILLRRPG
ncbi:MAG TPA: hypothetical protein VK074_05405 [Fodinibius sp.]|nr:hypothetical protein [Fodinibius sp.]